MKSFIKISGILFLFLIQFTSCMDDRDYNRKPVYYFYDEPVAVVSMGNNPMIRNESYSFQVPGLANNNTLKAGNLLWTSFIVDLDNDNCHTDMYMDAYTATHFRYRIVDSAKVIIPADTAKFQTYLSDDYSAAIPLATIYRYAIDSLWFFGFKLKDNSNYTYELILNPKIESGSSGYPTLYIRAKQAGARTNDRAISSDGYFIFAFDVANFVKVYSNMVSSTNQQQDKVRFNLKYKTGVDSNGKDVYRSFMSNPIAWNFNTVSSD